MAETSLPVDTEEPVPPPDNTVLKAVVIGLGILIILALIALVVGAIWKLGASKAGAAAGTPYETAVTIGPDERLVALEADGDRLYLHLAGVESQRIIILDSLSGRPIGTVALSPAP